MSQTASSSFIQSYLFFGGRCEEALDFYRKAIGAEVLMLMRFSDSPEPVDPEMVPPGSENKIMHASFKVGESTIMASDGCGAPVPFSGFSLSVSLPDEGSARRTFEALAEGGEVRMPLERTFWSPCFGMLEDRFGVGWMVTIPA